MGIIRKSLVWLLGPCWWMLAACAQILGIEDLPPLAGTDGAPHDAVSLNPADDATRCVPACDGDELHSCAPERWTVCPFGCDSELLACRGQWSPSNGARQAHLDGVSSGISISEGALAYIQSDTGALIVDGTTVREPGQGIVDGIGFFNLDDEVSVVAVENLAVYQGAHLRALGTRALLILSAGNVYIEGVIDLSAFRCDGSDRPARCGGPGGGTGGTRLTDAPSILATGCAPGENGMAGGGGGGLGSEGAPGGGGVLGGGGGMPDACPGPALIPLRGGSGGGAGGAGSDQGRGGGGGGALQITSFTSIVITRPSGIELAGILASGGGGDGSNTGGGGGGAGGGILIEAPSIVLRNVTLAANGGGGGGGDGTGNATAGQDGIAGAEPAAGGAGNALGGTGGALDGNADAGQGGSPAGGGGGGAGIIRLNVPEPGLLIENALISPMPTRGELSGG